MANGETEIFKREQQVTAPKETPKELDQGVTTVSEGVTAATDPNASSNILIEAEARNRWRKNIG